MGNEQPKAPQRKQLTQFQVDVACLRVKGYVELNRDRRTNQALMKEKNLNEMLRLPTRQKVDEYQKFQSLVQDVRFIETCNIVIRYVDIIKDQSIRICKSNGDATKIADVMPYIESILFAADNLNLQQVMEFKDLMIFFFGPGLYDTNKLLNVDPEMKKLYKNPLPDAFEVNEFVIKFAQKYGFSEDQINASGHQFSSKFLQPSCGGILVDPSLIGQPQQGFGGGFPNQPNQQQFGAPGFGNPQQGGFGGNGFCNDFPPQNGGFGQNQGGQQGFGGNDFGYQNGGYGGTSNNQSGYPQNGGFQNLPPPQQPGFTNLPPPQGQGFGGNQQGGLGGTQQGGFGGPQQGGFGGPQQGGLGGPQQGGLGGPQTGGFGGPQSGGFGGAPGGSGSTNPYGNITPSNINNPYAAQTKGPSIMASQSMKAPQTQQQQFVPLQPQSVPQQPQQQVPQQPSQNNDLDDLEQRLARLQKGL